ncbi:MAG TPA: response regulator [Solirubrobacteraceae bacterium]|nr:response regulator [Solirubrobacteraceae bacterium]
MSATTTPAARRRIRVLVVDDHPALRAGLEGLLCSEPAVECVGALAGTEGLLSAVRDLRPNVVVLDYALGTDDGLTTCFRLKQQPHPPAVVLYSACVDGVFAIPTAIAQADAAVSKSAPIDELLAAVQAAAAGTQPRPALDPELIQAASARLLTEDLPVATMLLGAIPVADIADILGTTTADIRNRALRIIGRLQATRTSDRSELETTVDFALGAPGATRLGRRSGVSPASLTDA